MKKHIEISFIDNNIFYNLLQRGSSSSKNKNNFIIYDMSGGECLTDDFQNFISINEDISKLLIQSKDEAIKLTEIQKILPKDKEELFSKSKRFFNFLLVQPKDTEFLNLFNQVVLSFRLDTKNQSQQSEEELMNTQLLYSGQIKVESDQFINELERRLKENPDIEAKCSDSILNWRKAMSFYKVLRHNKIIEIHILRQSAQQFFSSYPFMHNYFISLNSASQQAYPNDILCNRLYFGNWKHASNEEIINSIGITHIVNMTCEVDNYFASNRKSSISSSSSNQTSSITKISSSSQQSLHQQLQNQIEQDRNQQQQEMKLQYQSIQVHQMLLEELPNSSISQSPLKTSNIQTSTMKSTITKTTQNNNSISTTTTTTTTTTQTNPIPYTKAKSINLSTTPKNITYLKINIDDEDSSNILQHFKETYQFIASTLKKPNNKILIHCAQGKSRSASIVCMYLMRTFKWTFEQTLKYVQDRREVANPNYGFIEQLKKFENNHFIFEGESLDELIQSQKQANTLQELQQQDVTESPQNQETDEKNVKKQQIQDFDQISQDLQIVQ